MQSSDYLTCMASMSTHYSMLSGLLLCANLSLALAYILFHDLPISTAGVHPSSQQLNLFAVAISTLSSDVQSTILGPATMSLIFVLSFTLIPIFVMMILCFLE